MFTINPNQINIKFLNDNAKLPTKGSEYSAGWDLYAAIDSPIVIPAHETAKVGTGLSMELPHCFFGAIFARSGLATKEGLRPANCVGVCDADYRGEYIVAIHNDTDHTKVIQPGDRIAQLIFLYYMPVEFNVVHELDSTERGAGGFGSTGE